MSLATDQQVGLVFVAVYVVLTAYAALLTWQDRRRRARRGNSSRSA